MARSTCSTRTMFTASEYQPSCGRVVNLRSDLPSRNVAERSHGDDGHMQNIFLAFASAVSGYNHIGQKSSHALSPS
eukprot:932899-Pleurochrysis_carterae.AAC.2